MQFNLLDYIILTMLLLSIITGLKQGFIKIITGIVNTLLAVIIGVLFYDNCINYLNEYFNINTYITEFIRNKLPLTVLSVDTSLISYSIPIEIINFKDMAETLTYFSMVVISFVIVFISSLIILSILAHLLEGVFSWRFLSWLNSVLGMFLVPAKNILILMVIMGITFPVIDLAAQIGLTGAIITLELIEHSLIANILLDWFKSIKLFIIV